jgi:aminoglycoside phosphotransferase (APT) family kinase protein
MSMTAEFTAALETVLEREISNFLSLQSCKQLTAGASQETYRITINTESGEQRFALRRSPPTMETDSSVGSISLKTEAHLFQVAGAGNIPGPTVIYVLGPEDSLGAGFIMDWLEGETLGQRIVRADELAQVRPRLARECGKILAGIHALDWRTTGLGDELPTIAPSDLVDETWAAYCDLNVPVPMIDYTWRWLKANLPDNSRSTLVHGDFRNGNLMVTPDGINAVLDWELAQIGDPVRDLGWLCVNSWRFGNSTLPVGGFGEIDDLLAGYRDASGVDVSQQELTFWQVYGSFWWAMATLQMANAWRTGEVPSLERPVIGRRSSEAQMDCVNLLIPGDFTLPDMDRAISAGTQLPMQAELLEGVAKFLQEEVAVKLESHNSFLAKVAANSLRIAQRESLHGGELRTREKRGLDSLLNQRGELDKLRWELVRQLRAELPLDTPGLAEHLRQSVAGQLAIDQPHYSALRQP